VVSTSRREVEVEIEVETSTSTSTRVATLRVASRVVSRRDTTSLAPVSLARSRRDRVDASATHVSTRVAEKFLDTRRIATLSRNFFSTRVASRRVASRVDTIKKIFS